MTDSHLTFLFLREALQNLTISSMKISACICLLLLYAVTCYSQISDSTYQLRSKEIGKGAVYAFIDEISCFTCNEHLKTLSRMASTDSIPFVVYILGADEKRASELMSRNLNTINNYVFDEFYVYNKVFDITALPMVIVLDKSGHQLFRGMPGKTTFDFNIYAAALEAVAKSKLTKFKYPLQSVNTTTFISNIDFPDKYSVSTSIATSGRYCALTDDYIVLNHQSKSLLRIQSDGSITELPPFAAYHLPFTSSTPFVKARSDDGKKIVLFDTDWNTAIPQVAILNPEDTSFTIVKLPTDWKRTSNRAEYLGDSLPIVIPKRIGDGYTKYFGEDSTIMFIGRDSSWSEIGKRDRFFYDTATYKYAWATITDIDTTILVYQNFTNYIDLYGFSGNFIRRIGISIPDTILNQLNISFDDLMSMQNDSSDALRLGYKLLANKIFFDKAKNMACLTLAFKLESMKQPPGDFEHGQYDCIGICIDLNNWNETKIVQLPSGFAPFDLRDGQFRGLLSEKGHITIATLSLSTNAR